MMNGEMHETYAYITSVINPYT